jgi:hypothetical protein
LIAPEEYDGCKRYGGHKEVCASVITGCYASPVFEASEHVLDLIALFVLGFAEVSRCFPALARWNAGGNFLGLEGVSIVVAVVSFISDQGFGCRQGWIDDLGPNMVGDLPSRQRQNKRLACLVDDSVQL